MEQHQGKKTCAYCIWNKNMLLKTNGNRNLSFYGQFDRLVPPAFFCVSMVYNGWMRKEKTVNASSKQSILMRKMIAKNQTHFAMKTWNCFYAEPFEWCGEYSWGLHWGQRQTEWFFAGSYEWNRIHVWMSLRFSRTKKKNIDLQPVQNLHLIDRKIMRGQKIIYNA